MRVLARILLGPGEFVVRIAHVEGDDQQITVRMLVNSLFWGAVMAIVAFIVMT